MGHILNKNGRWKLIKTHFQPGDYGLSSGGLQTTLADFIRLSQALTGTSCNDILKECYGIPDDGGGTDEGEGN